MRNHEDSAESTSEAESSARPVGTSATPTADELVQPYLDEIGTEWTPEEYALLADLVRVRHRPLSEQEQRIVIEQARITAALD